jgi:hypothetical protein
MVKPEGLHHPAFVKAPAESGAFAKQQGAPLFQLQGIGN